MVAIIISKLLYFINNKYGNVSNETIKAVISEFYNEDEIIVAKILLFEFGNKVFDDKVHIVNHKMSDNKKRVDARHFRRL